MLDNPMAFIAVLLCYARVQACLIALPGWGERFVPVRVKVGLALALTPLLLEIADLQPLKRIGPGEWLIPILAALFAAEAVIGLALGMIVRLASYSLGIAASAIAATTSLSQLVGGPSEAAPHPVGNLTEIAGFALLMTLGYPIFLVTYLVNGFELITLAQAPDMELITGDIIGLIVRVFGIAMILASPFVLGSVLYQCLQGIISRVMPSLPVVFIGAPAAISLALIGLALFIAPMLGIWSDFVIDILLAGPAR